MLTRACNKIETDLMKSHGQAADLKSPSGANSHRNHKVSTSESPRSSVASERPESSSPGHGVKHASSTSPIDYKLRPPSSGGDARARTPKRPTSSGSSSSATAQGKRHSPRPSTEAPASSPAAQRPAPSPLGMSHHHGICMDPMCRDPACPTTAARNAQFLNFFAGTRGLPPYFYPPVTSAALLGLTSPSGPSLSYSHAPVSTSSPSVTTSSSSAPSIGGASPFVCNWMNGSEFCGRRFSTSDDLMSHLRSHTTAAAHLAPTSASSPTLPPPTSPMASLPSPADTLAALQAAQLQALYPALGSQSALAALQARAASAAANSSLSPNSAAAAAAAAARYHPYARPGMGLPPPAPSSGFPYGHLPHLPLGAGSPFFPPHFGLPPFPYP